MNRIQIIGCSAAGKSTVARTLGEILDIEVIHLDKELWKPGCQLTPPHEEPAVIERLLSGRERWIIDGNYTASLPRRLKAADLVVMVDFPRWLCLLRAMKRIFTYFGRTRPDMGKGCPETVNISFFRWIWRYPYDERPELVRILDSHGRHLRVVKLRGDWQTQRWLRALRKRATGTAIAPRHDGQASSGAAAA
jgi:adenylate kinase family enzyme